MTLPARLYHCLGSDTWTVAFYPHRPVTRIVAGYPDKDSAEADVVRIALHMGAEPEFVP